MKRSEEKKSNDWRKTGVSSPYITALQEEEIQVDHVNDGNKDGTGKKGLIRDRRRTI
jgi:hypothetical protein